jgi:hypothetical protein
MLTRAAALTLTLLLTASATAFANDSNAPVIPTPAPLASAIVKAAKDVEPSITLWTLSQQPKRPMLLPLLYASYGTLQVLDIVSTRKAIANGAREANPMMGSGQVGTLIVAKAAAGVSTMYFAEKLWKKNRAAAIAIMAVVNGATAAVVAHNTHNVRR